MLAPSKSGGDVLRGAPWHALAFLFAAVLLLPTLPAEAQRDAPSDIGGWSNGADRIVEEEPTFRPLPDGYVRETRGEVEWVYHSAAERVVLELADTHADAWDRVTSDLGETVSERLIIRVGRNPEEMRELAPVGHPPPGYAVGVAYPRFGTVILTLTAPETWERPDMEKVLTHELSHIALYRAVQGHRPPRWFVEGVAIYEAGENDLDRIRTLWTATVAGNLQRLDQLSTAFPNRPHRVNVAYAQSADMVGFLRSEEGDESAFHDLIDYMGEGMPFEDAVQTAYGAPLPYLERQWRDRLRERFTAVPLLLSGTGLWVLASLLLIVAWFRRRRHNRAMLAEMEATERAEAKALERVEETLEERLAAMAEESDGPLIIVTGEPPQGRESDVPTVEHDGRNHTLH